jgi:hypothetical protein
VEGVIDSVSLTLLNQDWALWIAFCFSLLIFSLLAGNHAPAKIGQYLLVGVSLGYLGVLLVQHVLRPRLFTPLWVAPWGQGRLWFVLLLGLLLWGAAAERLWLHNRPAQPGMNQPSVWRKVLRVAGTIPAALMVGITVAAVVLGLWQGALAPQFLAAAQSGFVWSASITEAVVSVLVLLLTTATLLHWAAGMDKLIVQQPRWVQQLLTAWRGVGKRALWFAAGVIFARLLTAHLSLLIGRFQFLLLAFQKSILWQGAESIWRVLTGGS